MEVIRPPCAWCRGPIPARARRDAVCCSKRCRQARHRFGRQVGRAQAADPGQPRRVAYADPPYPGKAFLYRGHPDYAGEVDHAALLAELVTFDGWALSTSAAALPAVLALCPPGARVAAWHRGPRAAASWGPLSAWEPVIYQPARPVDPARPGGAPPDSLVCGVTPLTTLPGRVIGAKPAPVCRWIFDLLGAAPADQFTDMFPGSGAVGHAWRVFSGADVLPRAAHDASPGSACDMSAAAAHDASAAAELGHLALVLTEGTEPKMMIPVRVPADAKPVLASERRWGASRGHPVDEMPCPVCEQPLGEKVIVLILAGIAAEDRKPAGWTTGAAVAVHAVCAGVPEVEAEGLSDG